MTKPQDVNEEVAAMVAKTTGQPTPTGVFEALQKRRAAQKNPAAVALGRLGGLKGGVARAKSLSAKERSKIAKAAAKARWKVKD